MTEINGDHYNKMSVARFELERARRRIAELEAEIAQIHSSTRRMTFDHEWYLEGLRHDPGVYVLMRVGPVPEGYEPAF